MIVPAIELQEFLKEYGCLAFPGQKVLRADHFCCGAEQNWLTVFLTEQDGKQCLTDTDGQVLCRYDQIAPLFAASEVKVLPAVQDLLEQLGDLRNRLPRKDYETARVTLQTLGLPSRPFAPAYLVVQKDLMGVVDPNGQVIVPSEYSQIEPFSFTCPGDASLFLCRRNGHQLNSMDVYDLRGNCIFRQIGNLLPREETLLTPPLSGSPVRKVKSLWVIHQSIEHPFPEDPEFQLVREEPRRYTLKQLHLGAMEDCPAWNHCPSDKVPPREVLFPMAAVIGKTVGYSANEVLERLSDYRAFRMEKTPLSVRLRHITAETPLDKLGLSIRAHHCLIRSGLQTVRDLMKLSEEAIQKLQRSTPEIRQEILLLVNQLKDSPVDR